MATVTIPALWFIQSPALSHIGGGILGVYLVSQRFHIGHPFGETINLFMMVAAGAGFGVLLPIMHWITPVYVVFDQLQRYRERTAGVIR